MPRARSQLLKLTLNPYNQLIMTLTDSGKTWVHVWSYLIHDERLFYCDVTVDNQVTLRVRPSGDISL